MAGVINGGEVRIKFTPDTEGFRAEAERELQYFDNKRVPVHFEADDQRLRETEERINGNDLHQRVEFETDTDRLEEAARQLDHLREQGHIDITPDTQKFDAGLQQMADADRRLRAQVGQRMPSGMVEYVKDLDKQLNTAQRTSDRAASSIDRQKANVASLNSEYQRLNQRLTQMRQRQAGLDQDSKEYRELASSIDTVNKRMESTAAKIGRAEDRIQSFGRQSREASKNIDQLRQEMARVDAQAENLSATRWMGNNLTFLNRMREQAHEQEQDIAHAKQESDELSRALDESGVKVENYTQRVTSAFGSTYEKIDTEGMAAALSVNRQADSEEESIRRLKEQLDELKGAMDRLQSSHPFGVGNNEAFDRARDQVERIRQALDQLRAHGTVDMDALDHQFAQAEVRLSSFEDRIRRLDHQQVQIDFTERNYERVDDEIRRLEHQRIDVPVDIKADLGRIRARWAELRREARNGKDITYDVDLDLKTRKAREKVRRFIRRNNNLNMDVDLETKLATLHLKEFTRPRVMDVFVRLRGTDLGKIAYGATYGATGLGAVHDQFEKLVTLFDRINNRVPFYMGIANLFTAIGAAALRLTQATLGVGEGLVSMSKAALAAPTTLIGLGTAVGSAAILIHAYSNQIKSDFSGISAQVKSGFQLTASSGIRELSERVMPQLAKGLRQIAGAEGNLFTRFVQTTNDALNGPIKTLPNIFNNTAKAVNVLSPGISSLWRSFLGLSSDTSHYLPQMAGWVDRLANSWAHWLSNAEQTGRIDYAVRDAITQGHLLVQSMGDVIRFAEGLWRALSPQSHGLEGFESTLAAMARAVNSARFQDVMGAWGRAARDASHQIRDSFGDVARSMSVLKTPMADLIRQSGTIVTAVLRDGSRLLSRVGPGLDQLVRGTAQGLHEIITAIGDADPAFNSLLKMIGDMARTFGGTFAATLRDSAPLIKSIADAADLVARAFGRLPEPIRAAVGMYVTWGRAGQSLFRSLKTGILNNIIQMLQYRKALQDVGVSVNSLSEISLPHLFQAWHAAYSGNDVEGINALSAGLTRTGSAAESASTHVRTAGTAMTEVGTAAEVASNASEHVGSSIENAGSHASRFSGFLNAAKGALNGFVDLAGGWQTIAITGIFMGISAAINDVQSNAITARNAVEKLKSSVSNLAPANGTGQTLYNKAMSAFEASAGGRSGGNDFWNRFVYGNKFNNVKNDMKELGLSQSRLNVYLQEGSKGYQNLQRDMQHYLSAFTAGGGNKAQEEAAQALLDAYPRLANSYRQAGQAAASYMRSMRMITELHQRVQSSFSGLSQTFRSNHMAFTGNTQDARANRDALDKAAMSAELEANAIQSNTQAYGGQKQATQAAKNAIQGYRDELVQALEAGGMSEQQANKMADSVGLVADRWNHLQGVTGKTAKAFMDMMPVADNVKRRLLNAVNNGTIRTWKDFQTVLEDITAHPEKKIVFTADGHAVALTAKQCRDFGVKWNGKRWVSSFTAKDMTSKKMSSLADRWHTVGLHISNLKAILDADPTKAKKGIDDVGTMAEALGLTPAEVHIITSGTKLTKAQINDIKLRLHDKGFTDAQIKVALGLLGVEDLKKQVKDAKNHVRNGKPAKVPTGADTNGMKRDTEKGKKEAANGKPIKSKTSADTNGMKRDVDKARKSAGKGKPITLQTKADTKKARGEIKKLTKQISDLQKQKKNLSIKAKADTKKAQGEIKNLNKQIANLKKQSKNLRVRASANTKQAQGQIKNLNKQIANLKKQARNVKVRADADTRAANGKIRNLEKTIGSLRKKRTVVRVSVNAGGSVGAANSVRNAVNRIPRSHHTTINQSGAGSVVGAARNVFNAIHRIQLRHVTHIIESGAGGVISWANRARAAINNVPRSHRTTFHASMDGSWGAVRSSIESFAARLSSETVTIHVREVKGHALGGRITGPGTETSDSIPAMLSRNEMVINAAAVHKIDRKYPGLLDRLNTVGDVGDLKIDRPLRLAEGTVELSDSVIDSMPNDDSALVSELRAMRESMDRSARVLEQVNRETGEKVDDLRRELPEDINRNSAPWPSQRSFNRDVRGAVAEYRTR